VCLCAADPMFGPDSGKNGWTNLNFVYEKSRINGEVLSDQDSNGGKVKVTNDTTTNSNSDNNGGEMAHVEGKDRMERFLSIWEEEGCNMIDMTCRIHDEYASNSQFITHLMGRILGSQGLSATPIDTSGFKSVLRLIESTTADSFDLFYGLYKFNTNSRDTIVQLKSALDEVVNDLTYKEKEEQKYLERKQQEKEMEQARQTPQAAVSLASSSPTEGDELTHANKTSNQ
jgi:arogenate dehydrogenase (NADP+), plant